MMILRRISLRDFGRFTRFDVQLTRGLNVILGNNEEGKSTLREAFTLGLFQDPKTSDKKILSRKRWGATEQFAIDIEFEVDNKAYILTKDFQARAAQLEETGNGRKMQDARAIETSIKRMLGLGSRAVFESTVRISQREITRIHDGQGIADSLQKLVTGGAEDVQASKVLEDLDKALLALRSSARSNPGPLFVLPGQIAEKEWAIEQRRRSLAHLEAARKEMILKQARLDEARRDLERTEASMQACAERFRLEDEQKKAEEVEFSLDDRVEQVRRLQSANARAQSDLIPFTEVLSLPDDRAAEVTATEMRAKAPQTETPVPTSAPARRTPRVRWIAVGAALAVIGLVAGYSYPPAYVLALLGIGVAAWELTRSRANDATPSVLAAQILAQEQQKAAEAATARLKEMLSAVGCDSAPELRAKRREGGDLLRQLREGQARLEGLLAGRTVVEIEAERKAASKRVRDLRERVDEPRMRMAKMDQAAYQRLLRDIQDRKAGVASLQGEIEELRFTIRASQVSLEEIQSLEEETQALRDQLAAAQERQQILSLTQQVLGQARASTMVSAKDILESQIGEVVEHITRGRYNRVKVDPTGLSIELLSSEKNVPIGVALDGDLSTGTVEQVYLAARLVIAQILAQGRRPPLILDDPFVTFDPARTEAALALCKRLSAENQVLLFTCQEGYEAAADNVVRLPDLKSGNGAVWRASSLTNPVAVQYN